MGRPKKSTVQEIRDEAKGLKTKYYIIFQDGRSDEIASKPQLKKLISELYTAGLNLPKIVKGRELVAKKETVITID